MVIAAKKNSRVYPHTEEPATFLLCPYDFPFCMDISLVCHHRYPFKHA